MRRNTLIAEAALNPQRLTEVLDLLNRHAPPVRVRRVADFLENGRVADAIDNVTPAELFALASEWWDTHKDDDSLFAQEAKRLMTDEPQRGELLRDFACVWHAETDANRLLSAGTAEHAYVSDVDGIFQPDYGGKLGIQSAVLRGAGR